VWMIDGHVYGSTTVAVERPGLRFCTHLTPRILRRSCRTAAWFPATLRATP
jgi:hypothetical protein